MRTVNPGSRGDDGLRRELQALRSTVDQLSRRQQREQKVAPPVGGGVVGATRLTPAILGRYFEGAWGHVFAHEGEWVTTPLGGSPPPVTIDQSLNPGGGVPYDGKHGLQDLIIGQAGWHEIRLSFALTTNVTDRASFVHAAITTPRPGGADGRSHQTFPLTLGVTDDWIPNPFGPSFSAAGTVTTGPALLTAGDHLGLRVSWNFGGWLDPAVGWSPLTVDVVQYG